MNQFRHRAFTHLIWAIAVLIGLIAYLLWKLPNGSDLAGFIAFAASLASLVLATVAIFQALLSSSSLQSSIDKIAVISETIVGETSRLQSVSIDLSDEASVALEKLQQLPSEMSALRSDLQSKFEVFSAPISSGENIDDTGDDSYIDQIMSRGSFAFALAMFVMACSAKTGRNFSREGIWADKSSELAGGHVIGVIEAFKLFDVCQSEIELVNANVSVRSLGKINIEDIFERVRRVKFEDARLRDSFLAVEKYFNLEVIEVPSEPESGGVV